MVDLKSSMYFLPTKLYRQLSIMSIMFHEPDLRQQEIADQANMSGAMVNSYIKQLKGAGYIEVRKKNGRDLEYRLTESGRKKLMVYLMECSAEIVRFYGMAKDELIQRFDGIFSKREMTRVLLYGGSETARLVLSALECFPTVKVLAIVDSDSNKWGSSINGFAIQHPDILEKMDLDLIIIASFAQQNEIYALLQKKHKVTSKIMKLSSL